ncbi:THO complex subunit 1 (Tho1) (Nuclear matrix protein p84) [Durusdinium trenchii]|uniref:THO complex subunit 1 (Tho1) (Nuclear matrix protein p84) n=1 Tax=Durusdinium trenchii TaxID=1381693 RepID=A0ABP0JNA3_9DINO
MDVRAMELWAHAPAIVEKLSAAIKQPSGPSAAREDLFSVLGIDGGPQTVEENKAGIDDFEYALQAALLQRLEQPESDDKEDVPRIIELAAECVCALYERASAPDVSASETDRCKSWWMMFVQMSEETTKLVSLVQLERLVEVFERSLVKLRKASMTLAQQRLKEFDAKYEAEAKAKAAEAPDTNKTEARLQKEAKDREAKRLDERKKLISQLGVSPNGHVFLTLTSLLKQLSSRLAGSFNSRLRTRISLLLERLLALDHKAIANNQKVRTQDFFTADDLDGESQAPLPYSLESAPTLQASQTEAAAGEAGPVAGTEEKASSLGHDQAIDFETYKSFWSLQEWLQVVEKLFEKPESWKQFHATLTGLLTQFSKYPASAAQREPAQSPESWPPRQVPRARAFRVQMDDPNFRMQFLTQALTQVEDADSQGVSEE